MNYHEWGVELNRFRNPLEERIGAWSERHAILLLRVSLGIVYLWFGALKLIPGLSPAHDLAGETMHRLTFGMLSPDGATVILAVWEVAIGLGLLTGRYLTLTLALLLPQMAGTFTPLVLFPTDMFTRFPFAPTMEGQYILKNLVLVSAAIAVAAPLRHRRAQPARAYVRDELPLGFSPCDILPMHLAGGAAVQCDGVTGHAPGTLEKTPNLVSPVSGSTLYILREVASETRQ